MATKNTKLTNKQARNDSNKASRRTTTRAAVVSPLEQEIDVAVRKGMKNALKSEYFMEELVDEALDELINSKGFSGRITQVVTEELDLLLEDRELIRNHLVSRLTKV
jgi:hypothetical protein